MKPANLKTRIFLDSGDPQESKELIKLLGFLDGQTTNPTLIAKNPNAQKRLQGGKKFTSDEVYSFYKNIVQELSQLMPEGSISIEVYSDSSTTADQMFTQGKTMYEWIPNAHIKYPTTTAGLTAAEKSVQEGMRVNMTLCFSQEQAAAVYAATAAAGSRSGGSTKGAPLVKAGQVFLSPFIGRLDDIGENGMDLIKNIIALYGNSDHHVQVLSASVRSMEQFMYALHLGTDIITAPYKILKEWGEKGMPVPDAKFMYNHPELKTIPVKNLDLNLPWHEYKIAHELTAKGIEKFSQDWHALTT